jgi:hypothetical protein
MTHEWKDTTSYSQGGSKKPRCWSTHLFFGLRLTVMNQHRDWPGVWLMTIPTIGFEQRLQNIPLEDVAAAQAQALEVARKHFQDIADSAAPSKAQEEPKDEMTFAHEVEQLAERLYTVYCVAVGGKAWDGSVLPVWREFADNPIKAMQVNGWREVAREAIEAETGVHSAPLLPVTAPKVPNYVEPSKPWPQNPPPQAGS